jgi:hypothetical protein
MIKFLPATLVVLLALWAGPAFSQAVGPQPIYCNKAYSQNNVAATSATTIIFAGGKTISMCGWNISNTGGSSSTVAFTAGTGTNCGTNTVNPGLSILVGNGQNNIDHDTVASASMIQGYDLCWTITGSGTINAVIYYGLY